MSLTIHKFPFPVEGEFSIDMSWRARILCVQTQEDIPYIWAIVDQSQPVKTRTFRIFGTGHPFDVAPDACRYIGTFQLIGGNYIGHLFELEGG